ncbi:hypothetical protein APX81_04530 [Escherichia coli]|nr:hypothetical protein [Escherichia coli]PAZ26780.1 hypothetical protein APU33_04835 [Escherichia coli]PAZ31817.1 hypothetical protein APU34_05050 [Escherichia coli]PAZ38772.1 hypothetical protein APU35_08770 [Escherichia coli]PAZ41907.1 hypothetical protein APU36_04005 [Escherichia coli]
MKQEVEKWRPFGHPDGDIRDLSFLDAHQAVYVQHHEGKEPLEYRKHPVKAHCAITGVMAGRIQSA